MGSKVTNADELALAISQLETKAEAQKKDIEETFKRVSENLKPLNLMKNGVRSVFTEEHRGDLINALFGLGTGMLSRKLLLGRAKGLFGKSMGKAVEWGIAGLVTVRKMKEERKKKSSRRSLGRRGCRTCARTVSIRRAATAPSSM